MEIFVWILIFCFLVIFIVFLIFKGIFIRKYLGELPNGNLVSNYQYIDDNNKNYDEAAVTPPTFNATSVQSPYDAQPPAFKKKSNV